MRTYEYTRDTRTDSGVMAVAALWRVPVSHWILMVGWVKDGR